MPRISVILTTYNDDSRLALSLHGYARQSFRDFEIIVSNDGGDRVRGIDQTGELVRSFSSDLQIRYCYVEPESSEFRLALARNTAIRIATGRQLVISDGDCVPPPDLLASFDREFREDRILIGTRKRISLELVPFLRPEHLPELDRLVYSRDRRLSYPPFARAFAAMKDQAPENTWRLCWGCLFSAPTSKVKLIGGFDERFRHWGREDEDLAERLVKGAGCRFFTMPESFVYHLDHAARDENTPSSELLAEIRRDWTVVRNGGPLA